MESTLLMETACAKPTVIPLAFKTLTSTAVSTISVPEPHDLLLHEVLGKKTMENNWKTMGKTMGVRLQLFSIRGGFGRKHLFIDSNKRAAFWANGLFVYLNGYRLDASQALANVTMLAAAAGDITEDALAD